jgi:hypothetical protein
VVLDSVIRSHETFPAGVRFRGWMSEADGFVRREGPHSPDAPRENLSPRPRPRPPGPIVGTVGRSSPVRLTDPSPSGSFTSFNRSHLVLRPCVVRSALPDVSTGPTSCPGRPSCPGRASSGQRYR